MRKIIMAYEKANSLQTIYQVTNPAKPLQSNDPRYVNSNEVRGNEDVVDLLFNSITWEEKGVYTCQLFTGHRGSGKSTELLRLRTRLENAEYAVVYFEGSEDLDINDVEYSDIILAIVRRIVSELDEQKIKLDPDFLEDILNWFGEMIYAKDKWKDVELSLKDEAKIGVDIPILGGLLAQITGQIKSGEQIKETIRRRIDPQISQLINKANLLLEEASKKLNKQLVIIVDNLDRIPLVELGKEHTNHDAIYIDHSDQLRSLSVHMVYTVPISMLYSVRATVMTQSFPDYAVLPMIKNRDQNGQLNVTGMEVLRKILNKRIALEDMFEEDAIEYLCKMCGGHPRDLMTLVRYSTRYAKNIYPKPIDMNAVQRAVGNLITEYNRTIPEDHYNKLVQTYFSKKITNNADHRQMLYNQSVLEYYDGPFLWHDVHPVVAELPKFKVSLDDERHRRGLSIE